MPAKKQQKVNVEIYLEDVRLSHPHLFEPQQYKKDKNSKPRYTAVFILDKKKHKDLIADIEDGIEEIRQEMFDGRKLKADNICLTDGDDTDKDEYQGCMILRAARGESLGPPAVIDRDKSELTAKDRKPYGGCYVNAIVRLYGYDEYADQVNAGLEAVQYFRKGDAFGAQPVDVDTKFKDHGDDDGDSKPMRSRGGRQRDEDEDDRGSRRSRSRDDEDEDRGSRSRGRDRDEDEDRGSRRSRDRDEDDDRGSRSRSRDDDDDRGSRRRRNRDDD